MPDLDVVHLTKRFRVGRGQFMAVDDVSFRVDDGEIMVLLGHSGCGKTTTLRCVAGLETPDGGRIDLGNATLHDTAERHSTPVHKRDIGLVFQSFALWPHMSTADNICYPLKVRGVPKPDRLARLSEIARMLGLSDDLLVKRPTQLSGGQQQRVGLARALIARPKLILFDEPLSNLDASLRERLRLELRTLHRRLGFTGIYVTHDLVEALALGDRVSVMSAGKIIQTGTPRAVFEQPVTTEVAALLGFRPVCRLRRTQDCWTDPSGAPVDFAGRIPREIESVDVYARADQIVVQPDPCPGPGVRLPGAVIAERGYMGQHIEFLVRYDGFDLRLVVPSDHPRAASGPGDSIEILVPYASAAVFSSDNTRVALTNA